MKNFFYRRTAIIIIVVILLVIDYQYSNSFIQQPSALVEVSFDSTIKTTNETWQHIADLSSGNVQQIEFTMVDHQGNETEVGGGKTFEDNQKIIISQIKKELFDEITNDSHLTEESVRKDGITDPKQLQILAEHKKDFDNRVAQYTDIKFTKMTVFVSKSGYKKLSEIENIIITNRNNNLIL
jgi:hypothetical protein